MDEALRLASENGRYDVVKLLIENGAEVNVNLQRKDDRSSLMLASAHGYCNVVELLIEKGAEVNMQSNDGSSALMVASQNGHCDVVKLLIEKGAEVNMQSNAGSSALMLASLNGHCDVVKLLIEKGAIVNMQDNDGWSALMAASHNGHCDVVKLLIEKGAIANMQINDGTSALMAASLNGHCDVVELLIEKGAEVNVNLQHKDDRSSLMLASAHGNCDVVKLLIEKGAIVNMQSNDGWSALMAASHNGHCDVVEVLLEKGAEVDMQNNKGLSALAYASKNGHYDVVQLLIERKAEGNMKDKGRRSALFVASQYEETVSDPRVATFKYEQGARNLSVGNSFHDNSGSTAIELASTERQNNNAEMLTNLDSVPQSFMELNPPPVAKFVNHHRKREASLVPTEIMSASKQFKKSDELNKANSAADSAELSIDDFPSKEITSGYTLDDLVERYSLQRSWLDHPVDRVRMLEVSEMLDNWKKFARAAGLTEPNIVAIDRDGHNEEDRRYQALYKWHQKNAFLATYSKLIQIMLFIERADIAEKVCILLKEDKDMPDKSKGAQAQSTDMEQVIGDLVLFKNNPIGSGAFGVVFKGKLNKQLCAIKVIRALADEIQTSLPIPTSAPQDSVTRFREECERLESFNHPNIVRHLATRMHPTANHLVLALELMDCNLRQYFTPHPGKELVKLSLTTQSRLCLDIASALEYIHSRGVVHRDLCSDNILLACGGETPVAKVCDFGMSGLLKSDTQSVSLQAFAHKGYMPPEATDVESSCYNSEFDIFSFGALMVQIVRHLPTIKDKKERSYELDLIEASHPIKVLICECLHENRDNRPSASQLKRRLQLLLQFFAL